MGLPPLHPSGDTHHMPDFTPTERTRVRRLPKRAAYDKATVYSILDEGFVCSIGFVVNGKPVVIPTNYGRHDDVLYIHGSAASRMLRALQTGVDLCVEVTLIDGLVLARSAFHHSVNYRSAVIFGSARLIDDPAEKNEALRIITEHIVPGRWDSVRWPSEQELKATTVLAIPLHEASAKIRTGPAVDDPEDMSLDTWAGVVPAKLSFAAPIPDEQLSPTVKLPAHVANYNRRRNGHK